tara:strand:- start:3771 stop:4442 length:672 start_codon:yes stop_codon:yes gene_type:complete
MKVDSKLLEKYHNGFCTKVEQDIVAKWLASNNFDDTNVLDLPKFEVKQDHKEKIWKNIIVALDTPIIKVIPLYKKVMRYVAVACVVVSVVFMGADKIKLLDTNLALVNNTSETRTKTIVNGLELGLTKKSTANLNSTLYNHANQITFCGNMTIKNTTGSNLKIKVQSTCNTNEVIEKVLIKNKKYYAFTINDNNEDKLYIINRGQLKRMPPHLMAKMTLLTRI